MKKLFASLLILSLLQLTSFSQDHGKVMLGGNVSIDLMTGNNDYKVAYVEVIPKFGYFITPKITLGINAGLIYEEDYCSSNY